MAAIIRPSWFPNWAGEQCVIVASGPSAKNCDLESVRGRARVIAINSSWQLAPWCDVLYGCDFNWWEKQKGLPDFKGLKVSQDVKLSRHQWGVHLVRVIRGKDVLLFDKPGTIGWGGNSGFHCINLAAQFKVKRIVLVGYDMQCTHGLHWHGPHPSGLNNPTVPNVARWCRAVDAAAELLKKMGIEVINCSPVSALQNYPKMTLSAAFGD